MKKLTPILINKAIDLYANEPNITHSAVAERLGITNKTLMKLRKQPDFWHSVYAEFCIHMEGELPDIVRALLRECKAGSVQAIRLLLEWAGKLNKTLDINISSPFEKWLTANGKKIERGDSIEDGIIIYDELPERTAGNSRQKAEEDIVKLDKELIKKKKWLARRRELYNWHRRAEVVGIPPLPPKKVSKGKRMEWEMSVIRAEEEQIIQ